MHCFNGGIAIPYGCFYSGYHTLSYYLLASFKEDFSVVFVV